MPKVSGAHREARRAEIVAAAVRAITEKGISRTSMADIIAASGLSVGAIYGHFEGKREIIAAVADHVLGRRREAIDSRLKQGPPPSPGELVALVARGVLREGIDPRAMIQVWAEALAEPEIIAILQGAVRTLQGAIDRALRAWFEAHPEQAPDGPDITARRLRPVIIALIQGFMVQRSLFEDFDEDAYLETVRTVLPH